MENQADHELVKQAAKESFEVSEEEGNDELVKSKDGKHHVYAEDSGSGIFYNGRHTDNDGTHHYSSTYIDGDDMSKDDKMISHKDISDTVQAENPHLPPEHAVKAATFIRKHVKTQENY